MAEQREAAFKAFKAPLSLLEKPTFTLRNRRKMQIAELEGEKRGGDETSHLARDCSCTYGAGFLFQNIV